MSIHALSRFAQSKDIDRGSQGYQVWRDALAPLYFIGNTSHGEPFLTGDKSGVTDFQLSLRAQCELQSRFNGSLINASTEAFCFLILQGNSDCNKNIAWEDVINLSAAIFYCIGRHNVLPFGQYNHQ